jgi:hypothetical protein
MGASALTIPDITDPAVMEALACREAMALTKDLHLQNITVATDCLFVITAIEQPYAGSFSMVLDEVRDDARLFFPMFRLDMKIGHQTLMLIGWHVFLFLVKLDTRLVIQPPDVFVSRTMSLINKVP